MKTTIVPIKASEVGLLTAINNEDDYLDELHLELDFDSPAASQLKTLAGYLQTSSVPVAFPTETVYGLGADATRSEAVKGIYQAKQRPSDNPLIVHFASLKQIRSLLSSGHAPNIDDPIPAIYRPLIQRFWPGPLTILLPNPAHSSLAKEVTAGLTTFGARIPRHPIALALIALADRPIAAPSANASTRPSPTAAEHVAYDLDGRIEHIVDGGPCEVGVESTVVDGLAQPPLILRPGGISLEQIRECQGWEHAGIGYKDQAEKGDRPRAPGMKYRHYSPKARVLLYNAGSRPPDLATLSEQSALGTVGLVRTQTWKLDDGQIVCDGKPREQIAIARTNGHDTGHTAGFQSMLDTATAELERRQVQKHSVQVADRHVQIFDIHLGTNTADVARGIFAALRDLDMCGVDVIIVEGVDESGDHLAAAVMNRLKKAAESTHC